MENMEITFNEYLIERLYEIDSIKETTTQIQSIDYTQSGTQMLIASKDYIVIYDIENFIKLEDFSCQFQGVSFALFSCNSECIVFSGSLDNSINILNRQIASFLFKSHMIVSLLSSVDNRIFCL